MVDANGTRACVVCGVLFPRNGKTLSCSDACKVERVNALNRRKCADLMPTLKCRHCSKEFKARPNRLYCCRACKQAARHADPVDAARRKARKRKPTDASRAASREARRRNPRDRAAEFASKKIARANESARRLGERAIFGIAMIGCERYALAPMAISRLMKAVDRIDSKARLDAQRATMPRGKSEYTIALKSNPVAYIAAIGRWRAKTLKRKTGKTMIDDGTASAVAVSLMRTKYCLYCACGLTDDSRTIDHMDPLSKGGTHSASNLCACCWSCNNKKGSKGFMQFVASLSDKHRRRAVTHYEKLNGFVQQCSMAFGMAA